MIALSCLAIQKKKIKREVKWLMLNNINNEELVKLTFTAMESKKLSWEHSREFEFNGQMFDIVDSKFSNDTFTYYCYLDHAETALNNHIDNIIFTALQKNPKHKTNHEIILDFLDSLFITYIAPIKIYTEVKYQLLLTFYFQVYKFVITKPPFPPPQV